MSAIRQLGSQARDLTRQGLLALAAVSGLAGLGPAAAAELVMFESPICEWCARWHEEIGPIYPKTAEADCAPLRRVSTFDARPDDLKDVDAVVFTPTFVLMEQGQEVGRIAGYPGEDFFWPLLDDLLARLPTGCRLG